MNRAQAIPYVSFVVDDALNGRRLGADMHAIIKPESVLVGWQCGFEPLFVAVHSYIPGVAIDLEDAEELATAYLVERGWFGDDGPRDPDYVIAGKRA